jgi:hypothetical protein
MTSTVAAIARKVLMDHPAVLNDPEPSVLADSLGRATINLRVYFWLNGREHSWLKVRSSVIRLVKLAFQQRGISMPDEAREVVFPQGVPVTIIDGKPEGTHDVGPVKRLPAQPPRDEPMCQPRSTAAAQFRDNGPRGADREARFRRPDLRRRQNSVLRRVATTHCDDSQRR